jgi:hypothetical protein
VWRSVEVTPATVLDVGGNQCGPAASRNSATSSAREEREGSGGG